MAAAVHEDLVLSSCEAHVEARNRGRSHLLSVCASIVRELHVGSVVHHGLACRKHHHLGPLRFLLTPSKPIADGLSSSPWGRELCGLLACTGCDAGPPVQVEVEGQNTKGACSILRKRPGQGVTKTNVVLLDKFDMKRFGELFDAATN